MCLVDFDFGASFDFFERFQALAVARFVLVLGVVEILDALLRIVIVASPASQIAIVIRRWRRRRRRRWRWVVGVGLLVVGGSAEEWIAVPGLG